MKYRIMRAELAFKAEYQCSECPETVSGDTQVLQGRSVQEMLFELEAKPASPYCMPLGWASYGQGVFKCPECQKPKTAQSMES